MRLTKYGHACVRMEKPSGVLVVDPGALTPEPEVFNDVDAVLITHEHFDHYEPDRLLAAVAAGAEFSIYTCPGVARRLPPALDAHVVRDGDDFAIAGFDVSVVGAKHHLSHPDFAPVDNIGFLGDDAVFHPGDAFTPLDVPTLLVPVQAPWMTVPDLIAYLRAVAPRRALAIHDGLINHWGRRILIDVLDSEAKRHDDEFRLLEPGEMVMI